MSFLARFQADASNAYKDFYSNCFLGDDAGKSATLTLVLQPQSLPARSNNSGSSSVRPNNVARLDLGMTFLEINGRAYVKTVTPDSPAARAGVMPQDAVQCATVFPQAWMAYGEPTATEHATRCVVRMEQQGVRISYDELRALLAEAMDPTQAPFLSPTTASKFAATGSAWSGPPIPSSVNACVPMESATETSEDGYITTTTLANGTVRRPSSPFSGQAPRPVVFCFRRVRQRSKTTAHFGFPSSRLDDECDFATSLVKRLAPTADMETPLPDTWDELVHDGTDWLLGRGSILPPKVVVANLSSTSRTGSDDHNNIHNQGSSQYPPPHADTTNDDDNNGIPLDDFEKERAQKLALLRSRMAAESLLVDRTDDVEAVTIRGMIQKAVGLAFIRASKIVLGVSVHGGSGIVIARLSDGTWSAPSAIGTFGMGLGLQFGLECAEYIFILQTSEALDHFRRGDSFTVGGNVGAAFAGLGREAYGAASVGVGCGNPDVVKEDEYNDNDSREGETRPHSFGIAPIVAYAKSQGLYIGVSLEGSRIFVRDDINGRTYKFAANRDVTANDILTGKVSTPPEAEELYAALHSVEFTHEMSCLPRPPQVLRKDSAHGWYFNESTLVNQVEKPPPPSSKKIFKFLSSLNKEEAEECETFETQFKNFLYGGVSVQRLVPDSEGRSGRTGKERRTLWLMLPETGSLRLGFVSKLSDGEGLLSNESSTQRAQRDDPSRGSGIDGDVGTVGSEEVTLDSAVRIKDVSSTIGHIRTGNVQLSHKHSLALTDVITLSQEPLVPVRFKGEDKMEHLRVISIQDVSGTALIFLANNFREAELLVCGLKLLLEREATRLGIRGGVPMSKFGERTSAGAVSPSAARGYQDLSTPPSHVSGTRASKKSSGNAASDVGEASVTHVNHPILGNRPLDRKTWGDVPGRQYMRGQAAAMIEANSHRHNEQGVPQYTHGKLLVREIVKDVRLLSPLTLCRVLLLDSASPAIKKWEKDRGDCGIDRTRWSFPPSTSREREQQSSEYQLIVSGSMAGAYRTISFDRPRYGSLVRLSETHTVEADDSNRLSFTVTERNPRRGFSIQIRVHFRVHREKSCEASVLANIRPVGKDMSNQAAVHKAFELVIDEIRARYGLTDGGLIAGLISVVKSMAVESNTSDANDNKIPRPFSRTLPNAEQGKVDSKELSIPKKNSITESGLVSFEDMLKCGPRGLLRQSPDTNLTWPNDLPSTPSLLHQVPEIDPAKRVAGQGSTLTKLEISTSPSPEKDSVLIEVKPLPKIRLSLMPSPREEDEDKSSTSSPVPSHPVKKKKGQSRRRKTSSSYMR